MRIVHVVGVRPNFIKIAPIVEALEQYSGVEQVLVHTGQHFDSSMSRVFFDELAIRTPMVNLKTGAPGDESETGRIVAALDGAFDELRPECVVVVGDVNSTLAGALVAAKKQIPCAHVEAGLRSFDRSMPEENNRNVTDHLADLLLTPSEDADENLLAEGISHDSIHRVGNVVVDTLLQNLHRAKQRPIVDSLGFREGRYAVATLHRPSNVDGAEVLERLCDTLGWIQEQIPLVLPLHPRTRQRLENFSLFERLTSMEGLRLTEPMGYLDFLALTASSRLVLTDSGGLQEETTMLGIPCLTLRGSTERPVTVSLGTNTIVGLDPTAIRNAVSEVLRGDGKTGTVPPLWDGMASRRAARVIVEFLDQDLATKG